LAKQTNHWSILRTMAHREHNHLLATHVALTGRDTPLPRGGSDLDRVESRNDFPNFAAALDYIRPRTDGIPTGVSLPNYLIEGPLTWPGQHAGFLGAKHDPWQVQGDPSAGGFKIEALAMREGVDRSRIDSRRQLLEQLSQGHVAPPGSDVSAFRDQQQIAYRFLTSGKMEEAFDITRETEAVRERYGKNKFGQSLLLSRRMIEAGVPMVQATMGIVQTWDTHVDNWGRLKNTLCPQLDQGLEALMNDLTASGLLEQTLVIVMGEFGRTPIGGAGGRDHNAPGFTSWLAGGGIRGGVVHGATDELGYAAVEGRTCIHDLHATILHQMGLDHERLTYRYNGRDFRLTDVGGNVIREIIA